MRGDLFISQASLILDITNTASIYKYQINIEPSDTAFDTVSHEFYIDLILIKLLVA